MQSVAVQPSSISRCLQPNWCAHLCSHSASFKWKKAAHGLSPFSGGHRGFCSVSGSMPLPTVHEDMTVQHTCFHVEVGTAAEPLARLPRNLPSLCRSRAWLLHKVTLRLPNYSWHFVERFDIILRHWVQAWTYHWSCKQGFRLSVRSAQEKRPVKSLHKRGLQLARVSELSPLHTPWPEHIQQTTQRCPKCKLGDTTHTQPALHSCCQAAKGVFEISLVPVCP